MSRATQIGANLAEVRERIGAACARAGRRPEEVTVVAITKTWPASDVRVLVDLGIRHIGENRDQEAREKAAACADLDVVWHFVGQLQRNKAGSVARYAHIVESVDRPALVQALDRAAERAGRRLGVCLQVDVSDAATDPAGESGRGGVAPDALLDLAAEAARAEHLDLRGVMAVAPLGIDPRGPFDRLAAAHERLLGEHPGATMRSAGMSGDYEVAIATGATHVRLGSALMGRRNALK